jgi:predicted nucleotidyltransferase
MQPARGKEAEKEIERMVGRIAERFNPQKIILFGSYARCRWAGQ